MKTHRFVPLAAFYVAFLLLAGCVTTDDGGRELTATGRVALQEVATIAVRRAVTNSPRAAEKAANIRELAVRLSAVTDVTSIAELKAVVEREVDSLELTPMDRADAQSLLNICEALLLDYVGSDRLDAAALVRVNEFVGFIVSALASAELQRAGG